MVNAGEGQGMGERFGKGGRVVWESVEKELIYASLKMLTIVGRSCVVTLF
jgi:hypothetical protein